MALGFKLGKGRRELMQGTATVKRWWVRRLVGRRWDAGCLGSGAREIEDIIKKSGVLELETMEGLQILVISRSRAMVLNAAQDQELRHQLGPGRKIRFSGSTPDLLNQNLWGRGQQSGFLQAPPMF